MANANLRLSILCILVCFLAGCGGSGSNSSGGGNQSGLLFTSPTIPPTINLAQTVNVAVSQDVTWSLKSGCGVGKPVGTLTNQTATTATYNAPTQQVNSQCASAPNPQRDVVVATTSANQSAALSVTVVQVGPTISNAASSTYQGLGCGVGVTTCCPDPGTILQVSGSQGGPLSRVGLFTNVTLTTGGGVPPYTWTLSSGSLPVGDSYIPSADSLQLFITGTPVSSGCSTFNLQLTDSTGVSSMPTTFNFVVIPPSLKVQVPPYSISYNKSVGGPGVPYPPTALTASGGVPPYTWMQDPNGILTLPPGLTLSSQPSNSTMATISGTPSVGADQGQNFGQYPTFVQVSDSQQPYPAFGSTTLKSMQDAIIAQSCTPAAPIAPNSINGGDPSGGTVSGNAFAQGQWAFVLRGFDANGPVVTAGSVSFDGAGNITGGVEDITRSSGSQNVAILPAGSSYTLGVTTPSANGTFLSTYSRGCMTLANSGGTSTTFSFTLGGCSNHYTETQLTTTFDNACGLKLSGSQNVPAGNFTTGRIIEFDDATGNGTRGTGMFRAQDPTSFSAGLSGRYAFGLSGGNSSGGRYAAAGSVQASSGNLSSAADINDAGNLSSQLTGGSGTTTSASADGRATATLTVGPATYNLAVYVVSQKEAFLVTTDLLSSAHPILGGQAIATASSFSSASLQNSHMFHIGGLAPAGPDVSIGLLAFDAVGSFSGTLYQDQAGTLGTIAVSGAYFVDSASGRTNISAPLIGQNLGPHPFVAYLVPATAGLSRANCSSPAACVTGFLVGTDDTVQDGILEFQTSTTIPPPLPFTNRFLAGDYVYGNDQSMEALSSNVEGAMYATPSASSTTAGSLGPTGAGNQPLFQDTSYGDTTYCMQSGCQLLMPDLYLGGGSYLINTNGTGNLGGGIVSVTNGNVIFYIDESPLNLHPTVMVGEQ